MKQRRFEQTHAADWQAFAATLDRLEHRKSAETAAPLPVAELPGAYRRLCQQLAIARTRGYSGALLDRLNPLALRAYQQLYCAPQRRWPAVLDFLTGDFPRRVRAEARLFWWCATLFYLPLLGMAIAVHQAPELIYSLLSPEAVADLEMMYAPGRTEARDAGDNLAMFGFYTNYQ